MKKVQTGYVVEFYTNTCLVDVKGELIPCFAIKDVVVGDKVTIEKVEDSKQEKAIIISREKRFSALSRKAKQKDKTCLLYTSPSPRDGLLSRMPSSA